MNRFQILKGEELPPEAPPSTTNYVSLDGANVFIKIYEIQYPGILRNFQVSSEVIGVIKRAKLEFIYPFLDAPENFTRLLTSKRINFIAGSVEHEMFIQEINVDEREKITGEIERRITMAGIIDG